MSSSTTPEKNTQPASRPWMLSLTLIDKATAANLYMPFVKGGGVFVETQKEYQLGDSVFVLLTVGDEAKKFPINGKVVWVCGSNARGERPCGVGVQFPKDDSGDSARQAIEEMTGKIDISLRRTATL